MKNKKNFYRWAIQIDDIRNLNGINYNEVRNKRNSKNLNNIIKNGDLINVNYYKV